MDIYDMRKAQGSDGSGGGAMHERRQICKLTKIPPLAIKTLS